MIATVGHRLIRVPARLICHAGALTLRLPPGHHLLAQVLARIRALPRSVLTRPHGPDYTGTPPTRGDTRALGLPRHPKPAPKRSPTRDGDQLIANSRIRV